MSDDVRFHTFALAGVDPMTATSSRSFPRHVHDQYGIGLIDRGGHASWSGRGQVEAGPGDFICVNPGEVHDGHPAGRQDRSWRILYFDPVVIQEACADVRDGAHLQLEFAEPVFQDLQLRPLFNAAFSHTQPAGIVPEMICETDVLYLLAGLGRHCTSTLVRRRSATACIRRARQRIDDAPEMPLTLVQLAREAGLSRYQLLRSFSREVGLTPHAYIVQQRLSYARRLIVAGKRLSDVATAAGFFDQSHLNRCFRRQFGVTPASYATRAR
ncbi:MAG TPA: AraC family transcriptional regulator [Povalibacter sp.]|nr:AraC family transcriptional regulator [Povalibacter sp.]